MLATTTPPRNQLLRALPTDEYRELLPNLKPVQMPLGATLYRVGEPIRYVYFPEDSIISTVTYFEDGASIETGIIGSEGVTGVSVALSNSNSRRQTTVQFAGNGF